MRIARTGTRRVHWSARGHPSPIVCAARRASASFIADPSTERGYPPMLQFVSLHILFGLGLLLRVRQCCCAATWDYGCLAHARYCYLDVDRQWGHRCRRLRCSVARRSPPGRQAPPRGAPLAPSVALAPRKHYPLSTAIVRPSKCPISRCSLWLNSEHVDLLFSNISVELKPDLG